MGNYLNKLYNTHCVIEQNFDSLLSFYDNKFRKSDYLILYYFISIILMKLNHEKIPCFRLLLKFRLSYILIKNQTHICIVINIILVVIMQKQ